MHDRPRSTARLADHPDADGRRSVGAGVGVLVWAAHATRGLTSLGAVASLRRMADGDVLRVTPRIAIPLREIALSYARSGGPGGQNVNKVASKAVLRFDLEASPSVPEAARQRALARLASRLTRQGVLVLQSDAYRDQPRNRDAVLERLRALLAEAVAVPKRRRPTAPSRAARERRLEGKRERGQRKRLRGRVESE